MSAVAISGIVLLPLSAAMLITASVLLAKHASAPAHRGLLVLLALGALIFGAAAIMVPYGMEINDASIFGRSRQRLHSDDDNNT